MGESAKRPKALAHRSIPCDRKPIVRQSPNLRVGVLRDADPGCPVLPIAAALLHHGGEPSVELPDRRIFGAWIHRVAMGVVRRVAPREADVLVCAHDAFLHRASARRAIRGFAGSIPIMLLSESDELSRSPNNGATLFRSSAFGSRLQRHERIATGCVPDLFNERDASSPELAGWRDVPSVGFIGHVTSGLRSVSYLRRGWQHFSGFRFRERVLRAFESHRAVSSDFVRRGHNLGPPMAGTDHDAFRKAMRSEYVRSVFRNPYSLCIRGAGNWSYRLFETLSAGRIPVLIDTDCALPLEGEVPWDDHLCRIPAERLNNAPATLAEFHRALGPVGLEAMQRRNRELWQTRLEPAAFFEHALRELAGRRVSE
jgi:hypothetical protein